MKKQKEIIRASWEDNIEHYPNYERRNNIIIGLVWGAVIVFSAGVYLFASILDSIAY